MSVVCVLCRGSLANHSKHLVRLCVRVHRVLLHSCLHSFMPMRPQEAPKEALQIEVDKESWQPPESDVGMVVQESQLGVEADRVKNRSRRLSL